MTVRSIKRGFSFLLLLSTLGCTTAVHSWLPEDSLTPNEDLSGTWECQDRPFSSLEYHCSFSDSSGYILNLKGKSPEWIPTEFELKVGKVSDSQYLQLSRVLAGKRIPFILPTHFLAKYEFQGEELLVYPCDNDKVIAKLSASELSFLKQEVSDPLAGQQSSIVVTEPTELLQEFIKQNEGEIFAPKPITFRRTQRGKKQRTLQKLSSTELEGWGHVTSNADAVAYTNRNQLHVWRTQENGAPTESIFAVEENFNCIAVSKSLIVGGNGSRLAVYQMQDDGTTTKLGDIELSGNWPTTAKLNGDLLAVCNWNGEVDCDQIHFFSLMAPDNPKHLSSANTTRGTQVGEIVLSQSRAYLANGNAGLVVLDIENPAAPKVVGSYPDAVWCRGLDLRKNQAVLAVSMHERSSWVEFVDVSNLSKIQRTSRLELHGGTQDVLVHGNLAIAAAKSGGLRIVSIPDSGGDPVVDREWYSGGPYHQLASLDGLLFAAIPNVPGKPRVGAVDVFQVHAGDE